MIQLPRFREPKCCFGCSTSTAVERYEAVGKGGAYIEREPEKIKGLVLLDKGKDFDKFAYICKKCGYARPIETRTPLWWVTCKKCQVKRVSDKEGKCPKCD